MTLQQTLEGFVERGEVGSLAWAVARRSTVDEGGDLDAVFRISSMTKPLTAVAALVLVEAGALGLDDAVDDLLPELADRRVLRDPHGPLDETVPALRSITVRDLLTSRAGYGMDFAAGDRPQPVLAAAVELGVAVMPPAPRRLPAPDEWLRRLGTLPLVHQPGARWLYHTPMEILGVLVGRAAGTTFDRVLAERVLEPLGMRRTTFWSDRLGPCWSDATAVYDPPDGQWSRPPAFPNGGDGLVSSAGDYLAFATMLLRGGDPLLRPGTVAQMTTDHVGDPGWGFGVGIEPDGSYGWGGGLGSVWRNDAGRGTAAVLLTDRMWSSPSSPPLVDAFLGEALSPGC